MQELEAKLLKISEQIINLKKSPADKLIEQKLNKKYNGLLEKYYQEMTPIERVNIARLPQRPNAKVYIKELFTEFFQQSGDRLSNEDESILGGIAYYKGRPVTVIAHLKGETLEENIRCNFGMPNPSGYRKVLRLARQAEKFGRPIITFIDTPGAYPGIEAEKQGQGEAIAQCLALFSDLTVPVIAVVIGEGGSGGALALGVANTVVMLENAVYSILSPEGFASILWKDASRKEEACELLKLTAYDLQKHGVCDHIVIEGAGNVIGNQERVLKSLDAVIERELQHFDKMNKNTIRQHRYDKFRSIGEVARLQWEDK